jgi:hypothetical protein
MHAWMHGGGKAAMGFKHGLLTAVAVLGLSSAAPAMAQVTGLNGMWLLDEGDFGRREAPPLKPDVAAAVEAKRKATGPDGPVLSNDNKLCLPSGMTTMMANEFALEFLETPGRVTIISENSPLVRSVYLTKSSHGPDVQPSWNGHSIGKWEGKTLVIDTIGFNDRKSYIGRDLPPSTQTHTVERYTVSADGKALNGEITFHDPSILSRPWTQKHSYHRLAEDAELWEYACEVGAAGWSERFEGDPEAKIVPKS